MLLDSAANDPQLGLFVTRLVTMLYQNDPATNMTNVFRQELGLVRFNGVFRPSTLTTPAIYYGNDGDNGFFVAGGTENVTQGQNLLNGYSTSAIFGGSPPANSYLAAIGDVLLADQNLLNVYQCNRCFWTGHSLGGALAVVLAFPYLRNRPQGRSIIVTLGAPRSGGQAFARFMSGSNNCRWMNDSDPVPLVPPSFDEAPIALMAYTIPELIAWAGQAHISGGTEMDPQGNPTERVLPSVAQVSPTTSLAAWLLSLETGAPNTHQIVEYALRFQTYIINHPQRPVPGGVIAPVEIVDPLDRREQRREEDLVVRELMAQGAFQQDGAEVLPPQLIFYKVKFRGVWCVGFGDLVFAVGPTRRRAGLMARAGNLFIRRLLRQALVNPDTLSTQWTGFLEIASDPTSEIRPTMRTAIGS
jgi:hypothetical protein